MKKILIFVVIVGMFLAGCSHSSQNDVPLPVNNESGDDDNYVEVSVKGVNYAFEPSEIVLKKGQRVRLRFESEQGFHDLVVDELNIQTKRVSEDGRDEIFFTPQEVGEFEFYCSVGDHRQKGMVGTIKIIE